MILSGYKTLELIHFYTVGSDEVRSWTIHENSLAPKAASVIHTDFERGYISSEVISYEEFKKLGNDVKLIFYLNFKFLNF